MSIRAGAYGYGYGYGWAAREPTARGRGGPPGGFVPARNPEGRPCARPGGHLHGTCPAGCPGAPPLGVPRDGNGSGGNGSGGRGPGGPARWPRGATPRGTGGPGPGRADPGQPGRRIGGVRRGRGPDSGPDTHPARYAGRGCGAAGRGVRSRTCPGACQRPRPGSTPVHGDRTRPSPVSASTPYTHCDLHFPLRFDPRATSPRRPKSVAGFHGPEMRPPRVRRDPPLLPARGARGVSEGPGPRRRPARESWHARRVVTPRAYDRRRCGAGTPHGSSCRSGRPPGTTAPGRPALRRTAPDGPGPSGRIPERRPGHPAAPAGEPA